MWNFLKTRDVDLAIATIGLTVLTTGPAWAVSAPLPGPGTGIFVGAAIVGGIVVAKWWRRR